jgi:hypothetical protein
MAASPVEFASHELCRADDVSVKLRFGDLWAEKPVVAVFLRR